MEILRRKLIYNLFIEQFIEMANVSLKYHAYDHAIKLLKQSQRLCNLLLDDKFFSDAQKYLQTIEVMRVNIERDKITNLDGPELPRRLSLADSENITNRMRYRRPQNILKTTEEIDTNTSEQQDKRDNCDEEVASDDDNDEIYSYHRSIVAQIHSTPAQNLARFKHNDDENEEVEEITEYMEKIELDNVTKF